MAYVCPRIILCYFNITVLQSLQSYHLENNFFLLLSATDPENIMSHSEYENHAVPENQRRVGMLSPQTEPGEH